MQVTPLIASERSCPNCAVARTGAFRYCRACGHDFEQGRENGRSGVDEAAAVEPGATIGPAAAPAAGQRRTGSLASRPEPPIVVGPGMPASDAPPPRLGGRLRYMRRSPGLEADRRTILLGIAIGALAGLGVVILMSLLTGPA